MNLGSEVDAIAIAAAVRQGEISAVEVVTAALNRIAARDRELRYKRSLYTLYMSEKVPPTVHASTL